MENKEIHITSLKALLEAVQHLNSEAERTLLIEKLKQLNTTDEALEGALLFLEDNDWNLEVLQSSTEQITANLERNVKPTRKNSLGKNITKYAAFFLLPLSILFSYYYLNRTSEIEKWYIEEPGLPNYLSDNKVKKWERPMQAYKEGNYTLCLEKLALIPAAKNNDTILYFSAVSNYKIGEYDRSLVLFEKLINIPKSVFHQDAEFRVGYTLYQLNKPKESEASFRKIASNKNHSFTAEAKLILENLFDNK